MTLSGPFIRRPVATTLLTIAMTLLGVLGYFMLPVSPMPEIEFPSIQVSASLPGANPETMATAVATPLERQFGRIAGVTEMTSSSSLGNTSITLQFDFSRNIDAAARDVQAAINAARSQLPANLPNNPSYQKVNPADSPIMIFALTSDTYTKLQMYDIASSILQQKIAQVQGVGQVTIGGGSNPAVRVDVNPTILNALGLSLADVRATLTAANANRPKGSITSSTRTWSITASDQLFKAEEYENLVITFRNGAPIRIRDVAKVTDSIEDVRSFGIANGRPAVSIIVYRQPGENIIATVDRLRETLPQLRTQIPAGIDMDVTMDRTMTIRASLHDVQFTLVLSVVLVILVVFAFLRDVRATLIPSIAVPVSLVTTFGVMYLFGYTLDNLSLMALTIATGFVVDDAVVVIENVSRYLEQGMSPRKAALIGAREIGFTVLSISISLVAVFIPILLMRGLVGLLFREFAVTLSAAIVISLIVSLTTTPMLCALFLKPHDPQKKHGRTFQLSEKFYDWVLGWYSRSLIVVLRHQWATMVVMVGTVALTVYLYAIVPKGFFPQQDTGRIMASVMADQSISFNAMTTLVQQYAAVVAADPDVASVVAFAGGGRGGATNSARMFATLVPQSERQLNSDGVIGRIRAKAGKIPGGTLLMQVSQDLRFGGRGSSAQFQYTIRGNSLQELNEWTPKLLTEFKKIPGIADVNTDAQSKGLQTRLEVDRETAARLGIDFATIDNTLYDAFGQRQVSTMYLPLNQYRVVMEVDDAYAEGPESIRHIYVKTSNGSLVPLSDLYQPRMTNASLSVAHSGQFPSSTISFNLLHGTSLGDIVPKVEDLVNNLGMPESIQGQFAGTAQAFQHSLSNQPLLILAALVTVYIVLGMLYESYIHPLTILSTLPSAGVGAILALMLCGMDLNVIGMIGILLLIGIVKKNAILMIDFALDAERNRGMTPQDAIFEACVLRFRPITMTTMAALLGGLPMAIGMGTGAELRQPLGVAIVGGLIFSQALTLYTTPVVYLFLDRLRKRSPEEVAREEANRWEPGMVGMQPTVG
ncbi:Multidrug resistance protein MdtC [Caulifigura coniformis]|uniref:Multidrug resistance protein MdtC n=1 Tax=Caulifigura coniformis TaxID=2527983 RepID=A0A517SCA2_9PLAN|nr:multidrug efflux RND transporter permease subunit [Caulifigura coniformis]QDT53759.1 Multidrug resistance protein MdtC [Caulifigura coniformis]